MTKEALKITLKDVLIALCWILGLFTVIAFVVLGVYFLIHTIGFRPHVIIALSLLVTCAAVIRISVFYYNIVTRTKLEIVNKVRNAKNIRFESLNMEKENEI